MLGKLKKIFILNKLKIKLRIAGQDLRNYIKHYLLNEFIDNIKIQKNLKYVEINLKNIEKKNLKKL